MTADNDTGNSLPPVPFGDAPAEPLLTVGVVTAAATALLALFVSLGLPVSADTQTAILAVIAAVVPIITALWGRGRVWAPRTVAAKIAQVCGRRPIP